MKRFILIAATCALLSGCGSSEGDGNANPGTGTGGSGGAGTDAAVDGNDETGADASGGSGGSFDAGASEDGSNGTDAATEEDSAGDSSGGLAAPQLDNLMKMSGALHVQWTNNQADCDTVRVERKTDADTWAEKYAVPGSVDNKMDGTATSNTTYTYRVRCEKGSSFSDYSNELAKNPKQ